MSQIDEGMNPQGAEEEQDKGEARFVSVSEAIRYRKRAQGAEKRGEELEAELAEAKGRVEKLTEEVDSIRLEQKLMHKLSAAGVNDIEAAVLLAKNRIEKTTDEGIEEAIEKLKKEKQYLFAKSAAAGAAVRGTAGTKEKVSSGQTLLERAAHRAAETGDRKDLQEYLRVRRSYL